MTKTNIPQLFDNRAECGCKKALIPHDYPE